jgi:hypothetical protein
MPRATPIYAVGHRALAARARAAAAAIGALALAGNAYDGVGVPDCGTSGEAAARSVLERLDASSATAHHGPAALSATALRRASSAAS